MKKNVITIALIAATAVLATAQVAGIDFGKLLGFPVKEVLVGQVFDKVWDNAKSWEMKISGYQVYYNARSSTYDKLGVEGFDGETYIEGRTIVVARIKGYFFNGEELKNTYLAVQPRFKEKFFQLSKEEKMSLCQKLYDTRKCFEMMLLPERQQEYLSWLKFNDSNNNNWELAEKWLNQNLPAEEVAKRIQGGELKSGQNMLGVEEKVFKLYPDGDIAKFAGRRFKEGGETLLRKYVEVIDLAITDTK